jgi:hypothetical protein
VVANGAAEQHDGATLRKHHPLVGGRNRQNIIGQAEP